jgi:hypothetical protein
MRELVRDDGDARLRRLFAQEFTTQLRRVGAASVDELVATFHLRLFKIDASQAELLEAAGDARRFGWVRAPENPDTGEWSVTETGAALPRPTSLATPQIATRLARAASPVREQATTLLPYVALVAGGVTALASDLTTATVVRVIAVAVLIWTFTIQLAGEWQIITAVQSWPKLEAPAQPVARQAVLRFYSRDRFALNVLFLTAVVISFGLGVFGRAYLFLIVLAVALVVGLLVLRRSLRATVAISPPDSAFLRSLTRRLGLDPRPREP